MLLWASGAAKATCDAVIAATKVRMRVSGFGIEFNGLFLFICNPLLKVSLLWC